MIPRRQTVYLITQILHVFPEAKILVLAPRTRDARGIWQGLIDEHTGEFIGLCVHSVYRPGRCVVGTVAPRCFSADIVVVANAEEMTGERATEHIQRATSAMTRVYTLISRSDALTYKQQLLIEAMSGPVIYTAADMSTQPTIKLYDVEPPPMTPPPNQKAAKAISALERKRALWHDDRRNDFIASIAEAVAAGDMNKLWEMPLFLDVEELYSDKPSVAILVESKEHGLELIKRLPQWPLRTRHGDITHPNYQMGDQLDHDHLIVTLAYLRERGVDTDVLIQASGHRSHPTRQAARPQMGEAATAGELAELAELEGKSTPWAVIRVGDGWQSPGSSSL